jgi:Tfp pilus assembly protein PilO
MGLVALDLLVFFLVYRPLGNRLEAEERHHSELRQTVRNEIVRVDQLKKFEAALPQAGKGLDDFMASRIPPRREAFSTAAHMIHKAADAAGVKLSSTAYHLNLEHKDPLEQLEIIINAQGSYTGLLKFSHALETANEFLLVREFAITPGDKGGLSLRLGVNLYLTP